MPRFTYLIQYHQTETNSWSEWIDCEFLVKDNGQVLCSVEASVFRVLDGNAVFWLSIHQGWLYRIAPNKTNYINAYLWQNPQQRLQIESFNNHEQFFTLEQFEAMKASADDYRRPPLFSGLEITELLPQPPDAAYFEQLAGNDEQERIARHWNAELLEKYRRHVFDRLLAIVIIHTQYLPQKNALIKFLEENYRLTKGTFLSYVAQPQHVVTRALIHIAEQLAHTCHIPAIDLLMPGIAQELQMNSFEYQNKKIFLQELKDIALQELVQTHLFFEPNFLVPATFVLNYLQSPLLPHYLPYCQYQGNDVLIHQITHEDIQAFFKHSPKLKQIQEHFETLEALVKEGHHLLGQLNLLVKKLKENDAHGGSGSSLDAGSAAYPAILNFARYYHQLESCYFIIQNTPPEITDIPANINLAYALCHDELYFLNRLDNSIHLISSADTPERFPLYLTESEHPTHTPAILRNQGQYFFMASENAAPLAIDISDCPEIIELFSHHLGLLPREYFRIEFYKRIGHPRKVCDILKERFTENKILLEEDLGFIESLTDHCHLLGYQHIPEALRLEIEKLLDFTKNYQKNTQNNAATCIGTRGKAIAQWLNHDLAHIGINKAPQKQLIQETQNHLHSEVEMLCSPAYSGAQSDLGLHSELIQELEITLPPLHEYEDLALLNLFRPIDLKILLEAHMDSRFDLIQILLRNHQLRIYLVEAPIATLEVILSNEDIFNFLIHHENLSSICHYLSGAEARIELIIKNIGINLLKRQNFYTKALPHLSPPYQDILYQKIFNSFQTHEDFTNDFLENIFPRLTPAQALPFIQMLREHFTDIIKTPSQIENLFFTLPDNIISEFYSKYRQAICELIQNDKSILAIIKFMPRSFYEQIIEYWLSKRKHFQSHQYDLSALIKIIGLLNENLNQRVFQDVQSDILLLIMHHDDCLFVLKSLSERQIDMLFPAIAEYILRYIDDVKSFLSYQVLLSEQQMTYLFNQSFDISVDSIDNFCILLNARHFNLEQKQQIFEQHFEKIIELVTYHEPHQFKKLMYALTLEQKSLIIQRLLLSGVPRPVFISLKEVLKKHPQLFKLLKHDVLKLIDQCRSDFINDVYHPLEVFFDEFPIFEELEGLWSKLIQSSEDIISLFSRMNREQIIALCVELGNQWAILIHQSEDFLSIFDSLKPHAPIDEILKTILLQLSEEVINDIFADGNQDLVRHLSAFYQTLSIEQQRGLMPYILNYFINLADAQEHILPHYAATELGNLSQAMQKLAELSSEHITWKFFQALVHADLESIQNIYRTFSENASAHHRFFNELNPIESLLGALPAYWREMIHLDTEKNKMKSHSK